MPDSSTCLVLSLASWTFGWSNGLISSAQPATATANSARKKIRPRSAAPWTGSSSVGWPASESFATSSSRRLVGLVGVAQQGEHPVIAVLAGLADRLLGDRQDPAAVLARRLGDQLLDPQAEALDRRRRRGTSACRGPAARARRPPRPATARSSTRCRRGARRPPRRPGSRAAAPSTSTPASAAGTSPKYDSDRVAPADVRRVAEHAPQAVVARELLERAAGIGDDHELLGLSPGVLKWR